MDVQEVQAVLLNILAFILLLVTLQPLLDDGTFPLQRERLFLDFRGCTFYGRDVFSLISGQAWLFRRNTGETPVSFLRLAVELLPPPLSRLTVRGRPRISQRRQKISLINQVLVVLIWLRKYPHVIPMCSGGVLRKYARCGFLSDNGTYWPRAQLGFLGFQLGLTLICHLLFVLSTNLYHNFGVTVFPE